MVDEGQALLDKAASPRPVPGREDRLHLRILVAVVLILFVGALLRASGFLSTAFGQSPSALAGRTSGASERASLMEEGKSLYAANCVSCHGTQGNRTPAAPLNSRQFVDTLSSKLEQAIVEGKGIMPAWSRERGGPFDPRKVKAVAEYLRSSQGLAVGASTASATATATSGTQPSIATPEQRRAPEAIPHLFKDQSSRCLGCHNRGTLAPMPVNHAGRANNTCSMCHQQGPPAPRISHAIQGKEKSCLSCHGKAGTTPVPASHETRQEGSCTSCHELAKPA